MLVGVLSVAVLTVHPTCGLLAPRPCEGVNVPCMLCNIYASALVLCAGLTFPYPVLRRALLPLPPYRRAPARVPVVYSLRKEMTGISPHALLAVSTMSGEETSGGGGGGSDRRTSHHQSHGRDRHNYDVIDGDGVNYRYQADNNSDTHDDAGSVVGRRARRESSHDDCHNGGTHSHGKGNGHGGHSHGLGSEGDGVWVRIALLLALSVHSIMEGLGVGAKSTKAFNLLFAIALHKV